MAVARVRKFALAVSGLTSENPQTVRAAYLSMELITGSSLSP
jgi:hypothetical protein